MTRLIVTGLSWAFKIIAPSARTEPHSVKEYRSLQSSEATNLQLKTISGAQNEDVHAVKDKHPSSRRDDKYENIALKRERYQLPVLDDILPELSKARVFSTVVSLPLNPAYSRPSQPPVECTDGFACPSVSMPHPRYSRST